MKPLIFIYKNWKGEISKRHVIPIEVWYGHTQFHTEDQWLMKALDTDKGEQRDFAILDILEYVKESDDK